MLALKRELGLVLVVNEGMKREKNSPKRTMLKQRNHRSFIPFCTITAPYKDILIDRF